MIYYNINYIFIVYSVLVYQIAWSQLYVPQALKNKYSLGNGGGSGAQTITKSRQIKTSYGGYNGNGYGYGDRNQKSNENYQSAINSHSYGASPYAGGSVKKTMNYKGGCTSQPVTPMNAGLTCSVYSGCKVNCMPNYQLPDGSTNMLIKCENGQWIAEGSQWNIIPSCERTASFNSYNGCLKCSCTGEYDKKGRHMSFPNINCPLRTDYSFRNKLDEDHHKYDTPLLDLPINMVEDIIIADSLHLLDLGIMRKCLNGWIFGSYNFKSKLSSHQINLLSDALEECNIRRPSEIHRKIRSLKCLKHWKGSEYHTFLCYLGIVVLKDVIPDKFYNHYLILTCAVTILSCDKYLNYMHLADQLIKDYIQGYIVNYGRDSISSNVHNLCHIINDVKKFGNLSNINTYPFENFLGQLKLLLRTGHKPLEQIAKRVGELEKLNKSKTTIQIPFLKQEVLNEKHDLNCCKKVFKTVQFGEDFLLSSNLKDKWFLTKGNTIVAMINGTYLNEKIYIYGAEIETKTNFFDLPIQSSYLNIFQSNGVLKTPKLYAIDNINCKLFSLKYKSNLVFVPIIHTLDLDKNNVN